MKKMTKKYDEIKYEALGFVEAMMAIMIVGIASVVLMQIAANTLQNVMQTEAMDNATQFAVEGAEIVQDIAKRDALTDEEVFPMVVGTECFALSIAGEAEGSAGVYTFMLDEEGAFRTFERSNRDEYKDEAILNEEDEFFRLICLENPSLPEQTETLFVIAEIIVGQRHSSGEISRGNLIKDYEYRSVIKFIQREQPDD